MKKNLLLLLVVSIISLSAFAEADYYTYCGMYLKRDAADPNKIHLVYTPQNNFHFKQAGITNLKEIVSHGPWRGFFAFMIPDADVTATMELVQNNVVAGSGASYTIPTLEPGSHTYNGVNYRILRFGFYAPPVPEEVANPEADPAPLRDAAFTDLTFIPGQEYTIATFTFSNVDMATTPIRLINEAYRYTTMSPRPLYQGMPGGPELLVGEQLYGYDQNPTVVPAFLQSLAFSISFNKLTTEDGNYNTNDCEVEQGYASPDAADFPNFIAYQQLPLQDPLPVSFGPVSATIANSQLLVHWSTLTETNNDHFIIEASKDGKTFTKLTEVKSQAVNGNSNAELAYNYATPLGAATSVLGALAFLGIGLAGFSTKKKLLLAATTLAVIAFTYSCSKKDMPAADAQQKIWVRIAQVDKDGTTKYSKAVEAVRE